MDDYEWYDDEPYREPYVIVERREAGVGSLLLGLALGAGIALLLAPRLPLARRELYWGFNSLLERVDAIRRAPGKNDFAIAPNYCLRALKELHIEFTPR